MPLIQAPFTEGQVASLNAYQRCGQLHEFTCGKCKAMLVANRDGWTCQCGQWRQTWAHDFMCDWSWKTMLFGFSDGSSGSALSDPQLG
jgi:hypothetical protein